MSFQSVWNQAMNRIATALVTIFNGILSFSPLPDVIDVLIIVVILFLIARAIWQFMAGRP
jgi:hypothetical protein